MHGDRQMTHCVADLIGHPVHLSTLQRLVWNDPLLKVFTHPAPTKSMDPPDIRGKDSDSSYHVLGIRLKQSRPGQLNHFYQDLWRRLRSVGEWELRGEDLPPSNDSAPRSAKIELYVRDLQPRHVQPLVETFLATAKHLKSNVDGFADMDAVVYLLAAGAGEHRHPGAIQVIERIR